MLQIEEHTLLNDVRNLKQTALSQAHDKYYPAIFRYISFKVGDQQTAEDLTSEVFIRLLNAIRNSKAPQKTLKGWLYGVASHVVKDFFRKKYRRKSDLLLTENIASKTPLPSEQMIRKQTLKALQEAIEELTDAQRNVIELRYGFEMPIKEVARTVGKSEGAVKQLQARGVAALARKMEPRNSPY